MLRKLTVTGAAIGAATTAGSLNVQGQSAAPAPEHIVQFALNLEYLEAEFYSVALTGKTLEQLGIDFSGPGYGPTNTVYGAVSFKDNQLFTRRVAEDLFGDELAHVFDLRNALKQNGITPVAKPAINLDALSAQGPSLADETSFLLLARIFEDIGLSAYCGGAPFLAGSPYLLTAARITGVEGLHVGNIRLQIARLGLTTTPLDGADVLPPPSGYNFFSTNLSLRNVQNSNGLPAVRTPSQVLYLAYGNQSGVTSGGFFPMGVNGVLNTSGDPATSANLATNPPMS